MDKADIILWTVDITLSVFSISFSFIAAYSSSKANKNLKEIISVEWVINASTKYFFDQMKDIQKSNVSAIKSLQKNMQYNVYSEYAKHTRFSVISTAERALINKTKYKESLKLYLEIKSKLDLKFMEIVDFKNLNTTAFITKNQEKLLINYHQEVNLATKKILKNFVATSDTK